MRRSRKFIFATLLAMSLQTPALYAKDEFQSHYDQASESFSAGRYSDAISSYQAAYRIKQFPRLLLMIGKAYLKMGHAADAIHHFNWFLDTKADAPEAAEVKGLLQLAQRMLAPPRADDATGQPGERAEAAPASSGLKEPMPANVAQPSQLKLFDSGLPALPKLPEDEPDAESAAPAAKSALTAPAEARARTGSPGVWAGFGIAGGLGAAAIALGTAAEVGAHSVQSTTYQADTVAQAMADSARVRNLTISSIVVGTAALGTLVTTGIVMIARRSSAPRVAAVPWLGGSSAGLLLGGRF